MVCCNCPKATNCLLDIPWVVAEVSHHCFLPKHKDYGGSSSSSLLIMEGLRGPSFQFYTFSQLLESGGVFLPRQSVSLLSSHFWLLSWLFHKYIPSIKEKKKVFLSWENDTSNSKNFPFLLIHYILFFLKV